MIKVGVIELGALLRRAATGQEPSFGTSIKPRPIHNAFG